MTQDGGTPPVYRNDSSPELRAKWAEVDAVAAQTDTGGGGMSDPLKWHALRALAVRIYEQARRQGDDERRSVERVIEACATDEMRGWLAMDVTARRIDLPLRRGCGCATCPEHELERLAEIDGLGGRSVPAEPTPEAKRAFLDSYDAADERAAIANVIRVVRAEHGGAPPEDQIQAILTKLWAAYFGKPEQYALGYHDGLQALAAALRARSAPTDLSHSVDATGLGCAPLGDAPAEEPTVTDVLEWLRRRPGASWIATIQDIEEVVGKIQGERAAGHTERT